MTLDEQNEAIGVIHTTVAGRLNADPRGMQYPKMQIECIKGLTTRKWTYRHPLFLDRR